MSGPNLTHLPIQGERAVARFVLGLAHHIQAGSTSTVGPKDEDLPRTKTGRKREKVEPRVGAFKEQ